MRYFHLAHLFFLVCLMATRFGDVKCWESYEMDLFDLVEDVNQNFYEVFGINQNSDGNEIRKAYRKLSLQWHPDKNPDKQSEAEIKFRQIVSIYEVLKDEVKRARYNQILEFGLPDWKQPIFYFRRVKKLSFNELAIAISIIITIGHYFVMWAQYFERKLTIEDRMDDVKKMLEKKQKKKKASTKLDEIDATLQEYYANLPSPKLKDTLPYRISMWFFAFAIGLPAFLKSVVLSKKGGDAQDEEDSEEAEMRRAEEEYQRRKAQKQQEAKRLAKELNPTRLEQSDNAAPVISYSMSRPQTSTADSSAEQNGQTLESNSSKEWTDKQKTDLIKAIVKFPAGTANRWTKIAEFVGRSSNDCIQMERQMKTSIKTANHSNLNSSSWTGETATNKPKRTVNISEEPTTRFESEEAAWSQEQQKCLENALKEIPKDATNRWDLIAEKVPNKTKDDCILRYKQLCASIKNKK